MRIAILGGLALACPALVAAPAHAGLAPLPNYSVFLSAGVQGGGFKGSNGFGLLDASTAIGIAKADAGTTPAPFVSSEAVLLENGASLTAGASASLSYYARVTGGAIGAPVGLAITAKLHADAIDGGSRAFLSITDMTTLSVIFRAERCVNLGPGGVCTQPGGDLTLKSFGFTAPAGHLLLIDMLAQTVGEANAGGGGGAFVDPYIAVTQPYAATYGVEFSPGITQSLASGVPEASTWAMMLVGLAGLGLASQRRRDRRGAAA
ncbi:MAG: hypothetical protein JNK46_17015 [Methylobacteriaceae bacterium]|nr:hypothetical protein [Methylobacteriaceae bacterium]